MNSIIRQDNWTDRTVAVLRAHFWNSGTMNAPDEQHRPVTFQQVHERRHTLAEQVRAWCEAAQLDAGRPELSHDAALALAAGHLDEPTRAVLSERRRAGRHLPDLGSYAELRRHTDRYADLADRLEGQRPGAARLLLEHRVGELSERLDATRRRFVHSTPHYAQGVRAVRRERRDGLHLEIEQREALFAALQHTPAPLPERTAEKVQNTAVAIATDRMTRWSRGTPAADLGRRAAETLSRHTPDGVDRFADRYDTLLYLAGNLYDRIETSSAWRSDHLAVQRAQLDLAEELTQIAVDTVALRGLLHELDDALASAPSARAALQTRIDALEPVWTQLVDRVAALARIRDLLDYADQRLRLMAVAERTASLDDRIDDLIGRSGARELSTDNTNFVGDQFGDATATLAVLQSTLGGDIAQLTSRD